MLSTDLTEGLTELNFQFQKYKIRSIPGPYKDLANWDGRRVAMHFSRRRLPRGALSSAGPHTGLMVVSSTMHGPNLLRKVAPLVLLGLAICSCMVLFVNLKDSKKSR